MQSKIEPICFSIFIGTLVLCGTYLALNVSIPFLPAVLQFMAVPFLATTTILLTTSYFKCMLTDPGYVPIQWKKPPNIDEEIKAMKSNRFCSYCNTYKPPRAHHCSSLNRCVLRMDHYCIWVCNCIGARNHKYFYLFLGYTSLTLIGFIMVAIYAFVMTVAELQSNPKMFIENTRIGIINFLCLVIFTVIMFPLMLMSSAFFIWHTKLILDNKTTIEYYSRSPDGKRIPNIFNISWRYNIRSVLGDPMWSWPLPVEPKLPHDGIHFPTNTSNETVLKKAHNDYDSEEEFV